MRTRILLAIAMGAVGLAFAVFRWTTPEEPDVAAARERVRARVPAAPSGRITSLDPIPWEVEDDELMTRHGPRADWTDEAIRDFHSELVARDRLGGLSPAFPHFLCTVRCSERHWSEPLEWNDSEKACGERCALDYLARNPDSGDAPFAATFYAAKNHNADLYRDLVLAHPEMRQLRRTAITAKQPAMHVGIWWGERMRQTAPDLQKSLWSYGMENRSSPLAPVALAASGWPVCVGVGGEVVCDN